MTLTENHSTAHTVLAECWTPDCTEPRATPPGRVTYWCATHDAERRTRIAEAMGRLKNDSYGMPRNPGTLDEQLDEVLREEKHDIIITSRYAYLYERDVWWWKCACGKESGGTGSRTEGLARAASNRHLRAVEKAAAA